MFKEVLVKPVTTGVRGRGQVVEFLSVALLLSTPFDIHTWKNSKGQRSTYHHVETSGHYDILFLGPLPQPGFHTGFFSLEGKEM